MKRRVSLFSSFAVLLAGAASLPASAAPVSLCGPNICYEFDNNPGVNAGITLFGTPSLLGGSDTLEFTPTYFNSLSQNGNQIGYIDQFSVPQLTTIAPGFALSTIQSIFQFTKIYAPSGAEIGAMSLTESGDYRIIGGGTASASLRVQVVDQVKEGTGTFPEVLVDIQNWQSSIPTGFTPQNWTLTSTWNPAAMMVDPAKVINLQIQNTLDALTYTSGQQVFIAKKLTLVTTTVVPVPPALLLFGSAMALMAGLRRAVARI